MNALERHRQLTDRLLLTMAALHAPIVFGVCWLTGASALWLGGGALVAFLVAWCVRALGVDPHVARATIATALMAQISLLVASMRGGAWQVDLHMYYFAMLALIGFYCDAIVVVVAAAVVAVHHLTLNFLMPEAIYPGGGDFVRVVLHAIVVVIESAGLIFMGEVIRRAYGASEAALAAAAKERSKAECATLDVERMRGREQLGAAEREAEQSRLLNDQAAMTDAIGAELARVAGGDLTARVRRECIGAFARLQRDLNTALAKLGATLANVHFGALAVRGQLGAIDHQAAELARESDAQQQRLGGVDATVANLDGLVARASAGATRARAAVAAANEDAEGSALVVGRAIDAMSAITTSSNKIGAIIGVIDEIAFQTNLLALNAGVEAARAGDAGRGFAVVATEVRALASRSAGAAKEIKYLINTSVAQVDSGAELVRQTGDSLNRIVGRVSEINGVVADIAASASEQTVSLAAIQSAVKEMEHSTRGIARTSEQASAVSEAVARESDALDGLMAQFTLPSSARGAERDDLAA